MFVADGGWELVGAIAALLLALAAAGSGRYGVDHVVRTRRNAAAETAPTTVMAVPRRPRPRHDFSARASAFTADDRADVRKDGPPAAP
jgi:putative oxidoreductase